MFLFLFTKHIDFAFLVQKSLLNLNVAACYLKMGDCRKSIETCNKVSSYI